MDEARSRLRASGKRRIHGSARKTGRCGPNWRTRRRRCGHPRRRGRCPGRLHAGGRADFHASRREHPYRALIEQMREGAATLTPEGIIHYCNHRFAEMLNLPLERVMGGRMAEFVAPADRATLAAMLAAGAGGS